MADRAVRKLGDGMNSFYVDHIISAHPGASRALVEDAFKKLDNLGYDIIAAFDRVNGWAAAGRFENPVVLGYSDPTANEAIIRAEGGLIQLPHGLMVRVQGKKFARQEAS